MNKKQLRHIRLLEALHTTESLGVGDLASKLGVSQVTIRKDLSFLAQKGMVCRHHGGVCLANPNNVEARMAIHFSEKTAIAKAAAKLVKPNSTIMVENGSCCAFLVEELATQDVEITIVTNSAFIAELAAKSARLKGILLGGDFQADSRVCVGPLLSSMAEHLLVTQCFLGVDGYSSERGFSNNDIGRAQAASVMASRAEQVVILTESAKLTHSAVFPIETKVDTLVTDNQIPPNVIFSLHDMGMSILRV